MVGGRSNGPAHGISAPKGGGALCGLGQTFASDLHPGPGNLTVPIELRAGRHGLQPDLRLVYSTGEAVLEERVCRRDNRVVVTFSTGTSSLATMGTC
jgi:hypothetical protein